MSNPLAAHDVPNTAHIFDTSATVVFIVLLIDFLPKHIALNIG